METSSRIGVGLLIVLATCLRFHDLDRWSLWLDEQVQYVESSKPYDRLYQSMFPAEMPAFFIIARAALLLGLDGDPWRLRMLPALFGVGTVVLVYRIARELFDQRTAYFSALTAAVSPVLIVYSQEYRFYSLFIMLTCLNGLALVKALRQDSAVWWAVFLSSAILSMYTQHAALLNLAGLAAFSVVYLAYIWRDREAARRAFFSCALAFTVGAVAFIPALPMLIRALTDEARTGLSGYVAPRVIVRLILLDHTLLGWPVAYIFACTAALGVLWSAWRYPRGFVFLLTAIGVPVVCFMFVGQVRITISARYSAFIVPMYCMAAGAGLTAISSALGGIGRRRVVDGVLGALVIVVSTIPVMRIYTSNPKDLPNDTKGAYDYLTARVGPEDLVLEACGRRGGSVYWFAFWEYYYQYFYSIDRTRVRPRYKEIIDDLNFPGRVPEYVKLAGRLWVVVAVDDDEEGEVERRGGSEFKVRCFRRMCVLESTHPEQPMIAQLEAFFSQYLEFNPDWALPAKTVETLGP